MRLIISSLFVLCIYNSGALSQVSEIDTGTGLTGGPIRSQGTIGLATGAAVQNLGFTPVNKAGDTLSGTLGISPAAGLGLGVNETQALAGAPGGSYNANSFYISSDRVAVPGANFLNGFVVNQHMGGGPFTGGRQTFLANTIFDGSPASNNANGNYVAATFNIQDSYNLLGTGLTWTTAKGAIFATNPSVTAQSGATDLLEVAGAEVNVAMQSGSSAYAKFGWSIVGAASDRVQGSASDAELELRNQAGAVGWRAGILFEDLNGNAQFPVVGNGTLIGASVSKATGVNTGIDFTQISFNQAAFASPGFSVDGAGRVKSYGYFTKAGSSGAFGGNLTNLYWTGSCVQLYVDTTLLGCITTH